MSEGIDVTQTHIYYVQFKLEQLYIVFIKFFRRNSHLPKVEQVYELPQGTAGISLPNLLLLMRVVSSWKQKKPSMRALQEDSLIDDVFSSHSQGTLFFFSFLIHCSSDNRFWRISL